MDALIRIWNTGADYLIEAPKHSLGLQTWRAVFGLVRGWGWVGEAGGEPVLNKLLILPKLPGALCTQPHSVLTTPCTHIRVQIPRQYLVPYKFCIPH